ncbi:hypothetical protein B0H10DRAFT_2195791 [Mycena sp. CBHHK59/15]|nr:hypothetical protein B0H10DRAFT_2195791 [Mycena sp. CBHHK59/15]
MLGESISNMKASHAAIFLICGGHMQKLISIVPWVTGRKCIASKMQHEWQEAYATPPTARCMLVLRVDMGRTKGGHGKIEGENAPNVTELDYSVVVRGWLSSNSKLRTARPTAAALVPILILVNIEAEDANGEQVAIEKFRERRLASRALVHA